MNGLMDARGSAKKAARQPSERIDENFRVWRATGEREQSGLFDLVNSRALTVGTIKLLSPIANFG